MFQSKGVFFLSLMICFALADRVNAEIWQLGYNKPVVEEILESDTDDSIATESAISADPEMETITPEKKEDKKIGHSFSRISTAKNTFGVETVESPGLKFYVSPVFGLASVYGNATLNISPQYAYGGRLGLLLADRLMMEGGYTHALMTTSAPVVASLGYQLDVFDYKQNTIDLGAKLFFLGRESRLRPFVLAGLAYSYSTLNYNSNYASQFLNAADFQIKQWQGSGQLGLEFAITRSFVVSAAFQMSAILTHQASVPSASNALVSGLESSRIDAGNSLSHSANYSGSVGVGVYF